MSGLRSSSRVTIAIQFIVDVGQSGKITLVDDCGRKTRLGEDHDAGGRLNEMGEHVREPTTRKKASRIFRCSHTMLVSPQKTSALAALPENRAAAGDSVAAADTERRDWGVHFGPGLPESQALARLVRAPLQTSETRSFKDKLRRVDHVGQVGCESASSIWPRGVTESLRARHTR